MESIANMSAPNVTQGLQSTGALLQYLSDIKNIPESTQFATSEHLNGEAYSILQRDELIFYFVQLNKVVSIRFDNNVQVPNAKHVFLFEAQTKELGMSGHFALVFGLNNFSLILIDEQYQQPGRSGYTFQWPQKDYSSFQQQQEASSVSFVKLMGEEIHSSRQGFKEHAISFLLGSSSQQKVFSLRVTLRLFSEGGSTLSSYGMQSVMAEKEEVLVYSEQATIRSRISNFISSKLGLRGEEAPGDASKLVREVTDIGHFIVIITNKDIIVVRKLGMVKVYESEYLENLKLLSTRHSLANMPYMRDLISFSYAASSVCLLENGEASQICLNLYLKKEEVLQNPQSYQIVRETTILHHSKFLQIDQHLDVNDRDDLNNQTSVFDLDKLGEGKQLQKAHAASYSYFSEATGLDVTSIVFLEFVGGKTVVREYSLAQKLQNIQQMPFSGMQGVTVYNTVSDEAREQIISVFIVSSDDVYNIEYDPALAHITDVAPVSLKQAQNIGNEEVKPQSAGVLPVQAQRVSESIIVNLAQLKNTIYLLLDKVASYKYAVPTKQQNLDNLEALKGAQINQIRLDTQRITSQVSRDGFLSEVKSIIQESIDVSIEDSHFYGQGNDDVRLAFSDDGLIQRNLENKQKKLDVINEYLTVTGLLNLQEDSEFRTLVNDIQFKVYAAKLFRDYQESIKVAYSSRRNTEQNRYISQSTDYSIEMRLVSKVLIMTANKLGVDKYKLAQMGSIPSNVVFSNLSSFEIVFQQLVSIALDSNIMHSIQLNQGEEQFQVIASAAIMIDHFLKSFLEQTANFNLAETFLSNQTFLNDIFKVCERLKSGCADQRPDVRSALSSLTDSFVQLAAFADIENSNEELFNFWKCHLCLGLENGISKERALEFARRFDCRVLLCRFVFELGKEVYPVLYGCIEEFGEEYLNLAIVEIYKLEKNLVEERRRSEVPLSGYRGFQMFEIFEVAYYDALATFLSTRNRKLFALLQLRHQESLQVNALLREEVIPKIEGVETMKVYSSLALTNLQNCAEGIPRDIKDENEKFYGDQLNLAQNQSDIMQNEDMLVPLDENQILATYTHLQSISPITKANLRRLLELINQSAGNSLRPPINLFGIKLQAWTLVVKEDFDTLSKLLQILGERYIYTDNDIKKHLQTSYLYTLASEFRDSQACLDADLQEQLIQHFDKFRDALTNVFQHLRVSNPNLFMMRPSSEGGVSQQPLSMFK